jgi:hypothetical protein
LVQLVQQYRDVRAIFRPAQFLLVRQHVGEPGERQALDDLGPVDQLTGVPAGGHPSRRELDEPVPELGYGRAVDGPALRHAVLACFLPRITARHNVEVMDAPPQPVREQRAAAEDHEVTAV